MTGYLRFFGRVISGVLSIALAVLIFLATTSLVWSLISMISTAPWHLPNLNQSLNAFGTVLLILIGIGTITLALAIAYFLTTRSRKENLPQ